MKYAIAAAAFCILLSLGIMVEISVWQECRQTNSWFYCMRVLHR